MQSIRLTTTGFEIRFTQPMDEDLLRDPGSYAIRQWHYLYRPEYGSPKADLTKLEPSGIQITHNGMGVRLELPLVTGKVYEFKLNGMQSASGSDLTNPIGWYTLNRLRLDDLR
jgi:hypothetical protein